MAGSPGPGWGAAPPPLLGLPRPAKFCRDPIPSPERLLAAYSELWEGNWPAALELELIAREEPGKPDSSISIQAVGARRTI